MKIICSQFFSVPCVFARRPLAQFDVFEKLKIMNKRIFPFQNVVSSGIFISDENYLFRYLHVSPAKNCHCCLSLIQDWRQTYQKDFVTVMAISLKSCRLASTLASTFRIKQRKNNKFTV